MSANGRAGWKRVKFGEVVRHVKAKVDPATAGLERFVAGEHMETDDLRIRQWGDVGDGYLGPAFTMRFKPGQVLYGSRRTYLRKVAVADFEGICANTTFVLEPADPVKLLPEFLPFVMQTPTFHEHSKRESKGSVNPYVNFSDLAWYEFALPPLKDQREIAATLRAATALGDATGELDRSLGRTIRSLLVDIFRPDRGARDRFPAHWQVMAVREAGDCQLGQQRHPMFDAGDNVRPYLRVANVFDGALDLSDVLSMHFPKEALDKFELLPGDILLNEGQSTELVGRSAIWRGEVPGMCFQKTLLRFRCGPHLLPEFAHAFFQHMLYTGQFARVAVQTTSIAHLTGVRFAKLPIPIPPLAQQQLVASRLLQLVKAKEGLTERRGRAMAMARCAVNALVSQ